MASIKLDKLGITTPHSTDDNVNPTVVPEELYTYKDIKLDIEIGSSNVNLPANQPKNNTDITDIRDLGAIKQSIENIFNTTPGEKILNPHLGMNLARFLFDPITRETGELLARQILVGLSRQEPRISVTGIKVVGDIPSNTYNIGFVITIPNLSDERVTVGGVLDEKGFNFV